MPLSENEQKILADIEKHLHQSDPQLAREVGETTVYRHALSSLKWSVIGGIAGMAVMLLTLHISYLLAFGGFVLMLVSALGLEHNFKMMGRAGMSQVSSAIRSAGNESDENDEPATRD